MKNTSARCIIFKIDLLSNLQFLAISAILHKKYAGISSIL